MRTRKIVKDEKTRGSRLLRKHTLNEVKLDYETTSMTQQQIADKYGVRVGSIKNWIRREGWKRVDSELKTSLTNSLVALSAFDSQKRSMIIQACSDEAAIKMQRQITAMAIIEIGMSAMIENENRTVMDAKAAMEMLRISMVVQGSVPYHPNQILQAIGNDDNNKREILNSLISEDALDDGGD